MGPKCSIVLAVALIVAAGISSADAVDPVNATAETLQSPEQPRLLPGIRDLSKAFQDAAERIRPSVVSIRSERRLRPNTDLRSNRRQQVPDELEQFFGDDFFERFFRDRLPRRGYVQRGLGTGVIVSEDGYIITNSHVIRGADEVQVHLEDGRDLDAKVVGSDDRSEVAVIRIDAIGLKAASLGNSDNLKVGEWVLAVGNPFQLAQTVTAGIVSARGRSNVGITDYEDFIQTDAAVNPGNSGGPLINLDGEVVGINTAIASRTGGYMGIGFAIPSNMVRKVMNQLIDHGRVERSMIGAVIQPLTRELAVSFGYRGTDGVLISDVTSNSPAAKAGLQAGDIVTHLNDRPVQSTSELRNAIAETPPGTVVQVRYVRDGNTEQVDVRLKALEDGDSESEKPLITEPESSQLGLIVQDATPELMSQLGADRDQDGAVVTETSPGGPADDAGVRPGDVIVSVDGNAVKNADSFRNAVRIQNGTNGVRLQIIRGGLRTYVFLKAPVAEEAAAD